MNVDNTQTMNNNIGMDTQVIESSVPQPAPSPEVANRVTRRNFTAAYKRSVLERAAACKHGELGALLRQEGLYASHLKTWGAQAAVGNLNVAAAPSERDGATSRSVSRREYEALQRKLVDVTAQLERATAIIDVQKKLSALLGLTLPSVDASGAT